LNLFGFIFGKYDPCRKNEILVPSLINGKVEHFPYLKHDVNLFCYVFGKMKVLE